MSIPLLDKFRNAYGNLDLMPLLTDEDLAQFGVEYGVEVMEELEQLLVDSVSGDSKILLSGHRGCGKSTLLAEVKRRLNKQFFILLFSISDMIEMSDVNHVNILFAIAVRLMEEAEAQNIEIPTKIQKQFHQWFAQQTEISSEEFKAEIESGFKLSTVLAWVKGALKTNATIRREIKQEFERNISDLVDTINIIASIIEIDQGSKIVVMVDDIDKLDLAEVRTIFSNHIKALFQPNFRIVMTIPIAALREVSLMAILQTETNDQIVQMSVSKLFQQGESRFEDSRPNTEVVENLQKILNKRIDNDLIEPEIWEHLILLSGGVLRELIRLTNQCCRICLRMIRRDLNDTNIKIDANVLAEAVNKISLDFDSRIGVSEIEILNQIGQSNHPFNPKDQGFLDLLHGLYILEYRNHRLWFDLHPIVRQLLRDKGVY